MSNSRLSWREYALGLAESASLRSEDPYLKVGACALSHKKMVVGVGYNGLASNKDVESEDFWTDRNQRRKYMIHAEVNCLSLCKKGEVALLAVTLSPCSHCATMIAAYDIPLVVYRDEYKRDRAESIFDFYGIALIHLPSREERDKICPSLPLSTPTSSSLSDPKQINIPEDGQFRTE